MQPSLPDTIVAVSSPPGRAPRGLIRISGPDTARVLQHLLADDADAPPRQLAPVQLRRPALPVMLLRFVGPASYTGEDAAELQLPGNAALLDRVLHDAINTPDTHTRLAEAGEFTFRAYTAGKLDLTQAEGVSATIAAVSDSQLAAAALLRHGKLGQTAEQLVDQLGALLALVEAGIDFTDQEDVTPIAPDDLAQRSGAIAKQLDNLLARSRPWGALEALPRVVLVGPPSTGKSTLFNAMLGRQRAVIDPAPGTTRDALAEPLHLTGHDGRPVEVMLVDLAGLDETLGPAAALHEHDAQRTAHDAIRQADLVLRISDGVTPNHPLPQTSATVLDVLTKQDANPNSPHREIAANGDPLDPPAVLRVSAHTGSGIDVLRRAIVDSLAGQAVSLQADLLALQPRHESALRDTVQALEQTRGLLAPALGSARLPNIELLANTLRAALDSLASLGGKLTPDEVIGRVFATFCVGK